VKSGGWDKRLSEADVYSVRRRYRSGEKLLALPVEYGVTQGAMSNIIRGLTYRSCTLVPPVPWEFRNDCRKLNAEQVKYTDALCGRASRSKGHGRGVRRNERRDPQGSQPPYVQVGFVGGLMTWHRKQIIVDGRGFRSVCCTWSIGYLEFSSPAGRSTAPT